MIRFAHRWGALALLAASSSPGLASAQAAPRPETYAIQGVDLGRAGADPAERATLVLRDGRIEAVLDADAPAPRGARVVDGASLIALPAFIDAYSGTGCETPQPDKDQDAPVDVVADVRVDMRLANRKGIQPAFRAADVLAFAPEDVKAWRKAGFGALLSSPGGELLGGTSALATVREAAARDVVVRAEVYAHATFRARGGGYPSTLMGYIAQLRQFFLDVRHHDELSRRYEQGRPGTRPPFDAELEAGRAILAGEVRLLCAAQTARDIERWIKLADEFGFKLAIAGGRDAWKIAAKLSLLDIPLILTLDWGEEVDDPAEEKKKKKKDGDEWVYREPEGVRAERRRRWEERRDGAIRLHEAGVRFAFGTGSAKPKDLMKNVRALIEAGLDEDVALGALTRGGARVVDAERRLGRIAPGFDATLVLWDGDPLTDKKAKPAWMFVDGFAQEFESKKEGDDDGEGPDEDVDVSGEWTFELEGEEEGPSEATVTLEMDEDGTVSGTYSMSIPGGPTMEADVEGRVEGKQLSLSGSFEIGGQEVTFEITGEIDGDEIEGTSKVHLPWEDEPTSRAFFATREPEKGTAR